MYSFATPQTNGPYGLIHELLQLILFRIMYPRRQNSGSSVIILAITN